MLVAYTLLTVRVGIGMNLIYSSQTVGLLEYRHALSCTLLVLILPHLHGPYLPTKGMQTSDGDMHSAVDEHWGCLWTSPQQ